VFGRTGLAGKHRTHFVGDAGSTRIGFDAAGEQAYEHRVDFWTREQRFAYAKALAKAFYVQLKKRQGILAEILAKVDDAEINLWEAHFLEKLNQIGSEGWGIDRPGDPKYSFPLIPEEFRTPKLLGMMHIYDVGSKVTFDMPTRRLELPLEFTYELEERFRKTFGQDQEDFFVTAGPGYVDVTRTIKRIKVEETLSEYVYPELIPKLQPDEVIVIFVLGDSDNDKPTYQLNIPESLRDRVAVIPIYLNRKLEASRGLTEDILIGQNHMDGAAEVLLYARGIQDSSIQDAPELPILRWVPAVTRRPFKHQVGRFVSSTGLAVGLVSALFYALNIGQDLAFWTASGGAVAIVLGFFIFSTRLNKGILRDVRWRDLAFYGGAAAFFEGVMVAEQYFQVIPFYMILGVALM